MIFRFNLKLPSLPKIWSIICHDVHDMPLTTTFNQLVFCLFIVYFRLFHMTQLIINKSLDGMLGTRTQSGRMEGADKSTVLWRHPTFNQWLKTSKSALLGRGLHCQRYLGTQAFNQVFAKQFLAQCSAGGSLTLPSLFDKNDLINHTLKNRIIVLYDDDEGVYPYGCVK